jgi:hypothetical protein
MKLHRYTVRGISPLLCNAATAFTQPPDDSPKTRASRIPSPEEEAASGAYKLNGGLGFTAASFRKAVITAAKGRKIGRLGLPGIITASVFETVEVLELYSPDTGEQLTEYEIDIRGARPPGQGMVRRARPRLDAWQADVDFEYDEELVSPQLIRELLSQAGMRVGVGNFRPEKSGRFGRFEVIDDQPL